MGPIVGVPLNIMCSSMWASPVRPVISLREPTLYHTWMVTTGAFDSSTIKTLRPFAKVVSNTRSASVPAEAAAVRPKQSPTTKPTIAIRSRRIIRSSTSASGGRARRARLTITTATAQKHRPKGPAERGVARLRLEQALDMVSHPRHIREIGYDLFGAYGRSGKPRNIPSAIVSGPRWPAPRCGAPLLGPPASPGRIARRSDRP